jgi:DNA-directed RNA polymerase I subunit RPA1
LREVWNNDRELFGRLFPVLKTTNCENPTDVFFLDVVPVMPPKFRPMNFSNGILKENGQSLLLKKIIEETYIVRAAVAAFKQDSTDQLPKAAQDMVKSLSGESLLDKMQTAWLALQESVNMIADTSNNREYQGVGFRQVTDLLTFFWGGIKNMVSKIF